MQQSLVMRIGILVLFCLFFVGLLTFVLREPKTVTPSVIKGSKSIGSNVLVGQQAQHPLSIEAMREKKYPGSTFVIEEELAS